jgi:phage terminase large subunit
MAKKIVKETYRAYGAATKLIRAEDFEVLIEGPAGTGKTRAVLEKAFMMAELHAGCRIAFLRKERKRLTDTVLVTWERDVLPKNHEARGGPSTEGRHSYNFPNGSQIVLLGLDEPEKTFSGEYDMVCLFEAAEGTLDQWMKLIRCMRSGKMPYQQMIADTNPSHAGHWLNVRAKTDKMVRLKSVLEDNPKYGEEMYQQYVRNLYSNMSGYVYQRMCRGEWVSAEGMIWENFDLAQHEIEGQLIKNRGGSWDLYVPGWDDSFELGWFFASMDFGYKAPGTMLVWGVDLGKRAFCVEEIYRTKQNKDWWADRCNTARRKWDILRFVCDGSEPDTIDMFNRRMGKASDGCWIAEGTKKRAREFEAYASMVREKLDDGSLYFLKDRLIHKDPWLVREQMIHSTTQEIPGYVYAEEKDGSRIREEPDPTIPDHGADALIYGMSWLETRDWHPRPSHERYPARSYGRLLEHDKVFDVG